MDMMVTFYYHIHGETMYLLCPIMTFSFFYQRR